MFGKNILLKQVNHKKKEWVRCENVTSDNGCLHNDVKISTNTIDGLWAHVRNKIMSQGGNKDDNLVFSRY